MRTFLMTLVTVSTIGVATAQQPAAGPASTDAGKAERNAARQQDLKAATSGTEKGYTGAAAEAANKAATQKHTPKVTPDAASKRKAVKEGTAGAGKGYTESAAESAAVAAKDKSPRAPLPKPKADTPEMRKVVP